MVYKYLILSSIFLTILVFSTLVVYLISRKIYTINIQSIDGDDKSNVYMSYSKKKCLRWMSRNRLHILENYELEYLGDFAKNIYDRFGVMINEKVSEEDVILEWCRDYLQRVTNFYGVVFKTSFDYNGDYILFLYQSIDKNGFSEEDIHDFCYGFEKGFESNFKRHEILMVGEDTLVKMNGVNKSLTTTTKA